MTVGAILAEPFAIHRIGTPQHAGSSASACWRSSG
jgi:hypothetical protein